ncbi:hypothetical protein E2C01_053346 [Portunus trituberculatus]|uniref:Uncharacterized protein n=1 Tax=Portunus trituberculatus TaxID=210409 RepID=A0A5B7GQJ0_PORTR|nr:hypothetical protein [Portunus trituberculatus]
MEALRAARADQWLRENNSCRASVMAVDRCHMGTTPACPRGHAMSVVKLANLLNYTRRHHQHRRRRRHLPRVRQYLPRPPSPESVSVFRSALAAEGHEMAP